jgi:DNA-binding NtrC family response regulator
MSKGQILLVDDEPELLTSMGKILNREGYNVYTASSGEGALLQLQNSTDFGVIITDISMPGIGGIELLKTVNKKYSHIPIIMMTAHATMNSAIEALRAGAWDYLPKPFNNEQLLLTVERAIGNQKLKLENRRLRAQIGALSQDPTHNLIGNSEAMQEIRRLLQRVAPTNLSVLITGESGTGKEVVAKAIHLMSSRSSKEFVPVDCATIPDNLMESELFGHEKGAFTGANSRRTGLVETANKGTFFLDEIGELDPNVQVKLLRLLQEREFRRVGGTKVQNADIRIVAATNRDLDSAVREGGFREDLFHRLNVVQIILPPLRERADDIPVLLDFFLNNLAAAQGRDPLKCSQEVLQALSSYRWPGNVRELHNCARYVTGLTVGDTVQIRDLPPRIKMAVTGLKQTSTQTSNSNVGTNPVRHSSAPEIRYDLSYKAAKRLWLEVFEVAFIARLLEKHDGNISHAARSAGIDRKSIQRLMKRNNMGDTDE